MVERNGTFASWSAWILTLLIPLLTLGCSPRNVGYGSAAPGPNAAYGSGGDEYYYYDYAEGEAATEAEEMVVAEDYGRTSNLGSRARAKRAASVPTDTRRDLGRLDDANYKDVPAGDPTPEPEPITVDEPEPVGQPELSPGPAKVERQIIYTATMQVGVHDVAHAIGVAEALPERLGGWLHQRLDNQLVLRIPAAKLEEAMDRIAELGVVDYRLLEALDVTAEYTDLESRIRVLEEMQAQLQALLARAKDVEQALEIRSALDQVTLELELARGRMRDLAKSIAFSTLILRFVERGPLIDVPTSNDPFTWVDELGVEITEYR